MTIGFINGTAVPLHPCLSGRSWYPGWHSHSGPKAEFLQICSHPPLFHAHPFTKYNNHPVKLVTNGQNHAQEDVKKNIIEHSSFSSIVNFGNAAFFVSIEVKLAFTCIRFLNIVITTGIFQTCQWLNLSYEPVFTEEHNVVKCALQTTRAD